jgi:hypothetical protein
MIQIFDQEIPNKMSELTIEQFEKISQILNNQDFDNIEKYVEMFKYLGIKEEMWDDYPFSEFSKISTSTHTHPMRHRQPSSWMATPMRRR